MSKDKDIINKLFRVVAQQQQIITKLAQNVAAPLPSDMRASVEADIFDILFGKGSRVPQFGPKPQVHYAKIAPSGASKVLVVGLTVPEEMSAKWQASQGMIDAALRNKYGVSSVSFKL
jgi:hypothetical protein